MSAATGRSCRRWIVELATSPLAAQSVPHAAHLSPSEAQALLERACDAYAEREFAQELQAEVRAGERELLSS